MKLMLIFLIVFLAGPLGFAFLSRAHSGQRTIVAFFVGALALVVAAFAISRGISPLYLDSPYPGLAVVLCLWMAWVVILALCFQAIKLCAATSGPLKAAFVIGMVATTLPWFGLYVARIMSS